jgi:hypothetical protein
VRVGCALLGCRSLVACFPIAGGIVLHVVVCVLGLQHRRAIVTPEGVLRPAKCKARATRAGT